MLQLRYDETMQEVTKAKLIVIEGAVDGIGKTTQLNLLKAHLEVDQQKVVSHHFPTYYSYQGQGVERYLKGEYGNPEQLSPYFINMLYAYDRAITWYTKLQPEFEKGRTLLLDRYTTSSLIYQSAFITDQKAKDAFLDYVYDFEHQKLGIRRPDQVFFLHAPFDFATKMRAERKHNEGIANDLHERDLERLRHFYNNSVYVAQHFDWTIVECATEDGKKMRSPEAIHAEIYRKLNV